MAIMRHIVEGTRIVRANWPLVIIAFLFKLSLAFLLLIPLQSLVSQTFGHRPAAGHLLTEWDLTALIDFLYNSRTALEQYGHLLLVGIIIALAVHLFLSGGLFRSLAADLQEEPISFAAERFFGWCGGYFWRFVKLAIASAIFYLAVSVLCIILSGLGLRLIVGDMAHEPVGIVAASGRLVLLILLLLSVNVCMTYAKISAVVQEERGLFGILRAAFRFLRGSVWRAATLYGVLLIGLLVITGAYWVVHKGCHLLPTALTIASLFFVQQVLSLTRSWYRLLGYASQTDLYVKHQSGV